MSKGSRRNPPISLAARNMCAFLVGAPYFTVSPCTADVNADHVSRTRLGKKSRNARPDHIGLTYSFVARERRVRVRAGPCPIVIILQLGYLPVTYFSSPSLLQSEWAVGQVRSSHVKTPVASSLVEPTTSELRVTIKMAVAMLVSCRVASRWSLAARGSARSLSALRPLII